MKFSTDKQKKKNFTAKMYNTPANKLTYIKDIVYCNILQDRKKGKSFNLVKLFSISPKNFFIQVFKASFKYNAIYFV